jgi:hypothetical protein
MSLQKKRGRTSQRVSGVSQSVSADPNSARDATLAHADLHREMEANEEGRIDARQFSNRLREHEQTQTNKAK